jgi:hypothetical protein
MIKIAPVDDDDADMPTEPRTATTVTVTIGAGESISNEEFGVSGALQLFVITPDEWTAANVTLLFSIDGVNFHDLFDSHGAAVMFGMSGRLDSINVVKFDFILPPDSSMKLRSGPRENPIRQKEARTFRITVVT